MISDVLIDEYAAQHSANVTKPLKDVDQQLECGFSIVCL